MEIKQKTSHNPHELFHFKRPRINKLFLEAINHPLVIVCAGSGYGKTSAVHDFVEEYQAITVWIQFSERDNVGTRFWENCANTISKLNAPFAKAAMKLGFPDTVDKIRQFQTLMKDHLTNKRRILVLDDFHFIQDPSVIRFMEECIIHSMPPGTSIFLLSRSSSHINISSLVSKGYIFNVNEEDLRFSENELAQYFKNINIFPQPESLREIMKDTEGWAFALNLIARSYQKAPGYGGYVRTAMKTNIFRLMETEIWDGLTKKMQNFFVCLSLIEHLSVDLVELLAGEDKELIGELEKQYAYVRRDNYINAYIIHRLFLEFLSGKQDSLSKEQKQKTYAVSGEWCDKNGFKIDAMSYYEKTGDYKSIISILDAFPSQIPSDIAKYASELLDKAAEGTFSTIDNFATMHMSSYMCQGLWEKAYELAKYYETELLKLPKNNSFRNQTLSGLYYCWACLRLFSCTTDDCFDFDRYVEKFAEYFTSPADMNKLYNHCPGPWINAAGTSRKGSVQEFIDSMERTNSIVSGCFNGLKTGEYELAKGEFEYYKGDFHEAEIYIIRSLEYAQVYKQFEIAHRALFYTLRLGIAQGNYKKAENALNEMKTQLEEGEYLHRYINYDITLCWYYCIIGLPEKAPNWLKEKFSSYNHAAFTENFANQMKAWYCYLTRNYPPLLSYIQDMKQRESFLFGRIEMLAMEACVHYKMKDQQKALAALKEAYDEASPNGLLIPFIELGKDMRTLTAFAMKEPSGIPKSWLENINRKSASYAKHQVHVATEYRKHHLISDDISLSGREAEVLGDLSRGLSRTVIASNRNLSINTVKMIVKNLYMKLGAENLADAIRIATERKII